MDLNCIEWYQILWTISGCWLDSWAGWEAAILPCCLRNRLQNCRENWGENVKSWFDLNYIELNWIKFNCIECIWIALNGIKYFLPYQVVHWMVWPGEKLLSSNGDIRECEKLIWLANYIELTWIKFNCIEWTWIAINGIEYLFTISGCWLDGWAGWEAAILPRRHRNGLQNSGEAEERTWEAGAEVHCEYLF